MNPHGPAPGVVVLERGAGRAYHMGELDAVFKVDEETDGRYSISEWWMQPGFAGVGAHSHEENDEVFYVLEGAAEILIGDVWQAVSQGAFVRIPRTVDHDFRNTSLAEAGLLNLFIPGDFEREMPEIVAWFQQKR
jgi:mannose-6-phosphate isomerase-like protein (cupin superfamily)